MIIDSEVTQKERARAQAQVDAALAIPAKKREDKLKFIQQSLDNAKNGVN